MPALPCLALPACDIIIKAKAFFFFQKIFGNFLALAFGHLTTDTWPSKVRSSRIRIRRYIPAPLFDNKLFLFFPSSGLLFPFFFFAFPAAGPRKSAKPDFLEAANYSTRSKMNAGIERWKMAERPPHTDTVQPNYTATKSRLPTKNHGRGWS